MIISFKLIIDSLIVTLMASYVSYVFKRSWRYVNNYLLYVKCSRIIDACQDYNYLSQSQISAYGLCLARLGSIKKAGEELRRENYDKDADYVNSFVSQIRKGNEAIASNINQLEPRIKKLALRHGLSGYIGDQIIKLRDKYFRLRCLWRKAKSLFIS